MEQKFSERAGEESTEAVRAEETENGKSDGAPGGKPRGDGVQTEAEAKAEPPMAQTDPIVLDVNLTANDLWKFSMYHSNKGLLGIFNVLFSVAAIFLLLTTWNENTVMYRILLIICGLMFTVWQPSVLYLKAAKQAKAPVIKNTMTLSFSREGLVVSQGEERMELVWENIGRVESIKTMLIVYMDKVHAYLLPDRVTGDKKAALGALIKEQLPPERRKRI